MEASTSNDPDVKTFRGRSLEEILPQIREELGPEAIVLRRREGLTGGVGGFFQRPYVEVDARAPLADERPLEIRSDRATAEGLSSPAVQALFEQATPFADALAAAAREARSIETDDTFSATMTSPPADVPPAPTGLYGPQPNAAAIEHAAPVPTPEPEVAPPAPEPYAAATTPPGEEPPAEVPPAEVPPADAPPVAAPQPATPSPAAAPAPPVIEAGDVDSSEDELDEAEPLEKPASAAAAEKRLVAAGLSPALAADVVGEAVAHGLPFAAPRALKKLVRAALARRIPVMTEIGPQPRTVAIVGAGGAGKSSAVAHLAAAYAGAGADVAVVSLRGDGAPPPRLEPHGVAVVTADDAATARKRLGRRRPLLTLIDTPAAGPSHAAAHVKALAADLKALG